MVVDTDVFASDFRNLNLSSSNEIVLKQEQDSALRAVRTDRDVLAILPNRYGKSSKSFSFTKCVYV